MEDFQQKEVALDKMKENIDQIIQIIKNYYRILSAEYFKFVESYR